MPQTKTMRDAIRIRPAEPGDAEVAAVLLYSAYTHTHVTYPPPEALKSGAVERLRDYFCREGNRFSYQNIQVATHGLEVVGLVLSFGGRDEERLNAAVGSWLEGEAEDDDWYVDALAVLENWSRQGIGTRLMQAAEGQARQHHYSMIALHVAPANKEAVDLYTRLGYAVTGQAILYGRPYLRMVKQLTSSELETEDGMQITRNALATTVGPSEWFTGAVYIDTVATPSAGSHLSASSVHFTPGARTAWHTHPHGQTIYVTEGIGRCQRRGGPVEVIRPGDRVFFEPGEEHWHGAAPDRFMTHLAMHELDENGNAATWGKHVTDAEYNQQPRQER